MKKAKSEKESRSVLLQWARHYGCEADLLKIFNRYDDLLLGCKSEEEKKAIQAMGVVEIHKFFSGGADDGTLTIDGEKIK